MQITLTTTKQGKTVHSRLSPAAMLIAGLLLILVLPASLGLVVFHYATEAEQAKAALPTSLTLSEAEARMAEYQRTIEELRLKSEANVNVLSVKLGRMQAQLMRSNALGQRLADMAGLDKTEFDFSQEPALGGVASPLESDTMEVEDVMQLLHHLSVRLEQEQMELSLLESMMADKDLQQALDPKGWPVKGSYISSSYGYRNDPFSGQKSFHKGVDIPGKVGAPVHALAAGMVVLAKNKPGFGYTVEIEHGNGYTTRYAHASKILVDVGDRISKGMIIAEVGSTGRSTGPHLHLELLKDGKHINPRKRLYSKK
jgi:murein DD-endopeptidase MepM/ murein hydrolase activator NlpD